MQTATWMQYSRRLGTGALRATLREAPRFCLRPSAPAGPLRSSKPAGRREPQPTAAGNTKPLRSQNQAKAHKYPPAQQTSKRSRTMAQAQGLQITRVTPYIIVSDTDLHGVSLGAALASVLAKTAGEENVTVVSHFDLRGPATTARGDVPKLYEQLASVASGSRVYIADVPLKLGAEQQTIDALNKLAQSNNVILIDHHVEVLKHFRGRLAANVDYRIYADAFSTYLPAMMTALAIGDDALLKHIYDLAVLGMVADMDLSALPVARSVAAALGFDIPSLDDIRANYHIVVAIDSLVKAPQKPQPQTDMLLYGNMSSVVAYLAKTPIDQVASEALQRFPTPKPSDVARDAEIVGNVVAVYRKLAPTGQGAKYAALLEAAIDTPIVVVAAPVPRVQEYVVVMAFPNAFLEGNEEVQKFLSEAKEPILKELQERGLTKPEWLRPTPSFSIPVDASRVEEALRLIAERLASLYAQKHREKLAAEVAKEELTVLVADERLAASVARIVEAAVKAAVQEVKELMRR